ncbi:MAG: hypothetical protein SGI92_11980 [Bryobacteraceae bacterium]|nr:hypothetical protein [Bryobacteraceae bacterium]
MAVFKPTYKDPQTGFQKESRVWWYEFTFAGKRIRESSKSQRKTLAQQAEKNRRLELEKGFNAIEENRAARIQTVAEIADAYLESYKLRNPRSVTFASAALGHLKRLLGSVIRVDVTPKTIKGYQSARLREGTAPKSINEETGFLLRILEDQGDVIRARMRRNRTLKLKVRTRVSKAYSPEERAALIAAARRRR